MAIVGGFSTEKIRSITIEFITSEWVLSAGTYQLDIQHNLESNDLTVAIWDNSEPVMVDRINILNTNTIRLFTTLNPDCRFDGKAIITKSQ